MAKGSRPDWLAIDKVKDMLAHWLRSAFFPPVVILVAILIATLMSWQAAKASLAQDISMSADSRADAAEQSLREHMVSYEQMLHGSAGLFMSSVEVTLEEWESFLNAFNINQGFAGVQSVGFIRVFESSQLEVVTDFMAQQGVENFKLSPAPKGDGQHAAVQYVHSIEPQKDLFYGYDMYSQPLRRAAMLNAQDSGNIVMTPRLELLPDRSGNRLHGFNMFAPCYNRDMPAGTPEERRAALEGFVFAAFRADVFFKNIIGNMNDEGSGFRVEARANGAPAALYQSPSYQRLAQRPQSVHTARSVRQHGQDWTIHFVFGPKTVVSEAQLRQPGTTLFFGVFAAVLISTIVLLLIITRFRDLSSQKDKAVELAKDELLSLASHQLRTPATGVKQYVGMLLQGFAGRISPTQRELLEKAYASNDRQLRIINEILHLAKIDSGRIVLAKQPTNLNDLINDIVGEQQADIEASKHNLNVQIPKKPIILYADTHILRMAIENIFNNAVKYTPRGGKIDVRVRTEKSRVRIRISDNGVGIKARDMGRVFGQFSRLPNEMSQQVGGTGIGLYLAKHLTELHKGSIEVESAPGKGSTFIIVLPLRGGRK